MTTTHSDLSHLPIGLVLSGNDGGYRPIIEFPKGRSKADFDDLRSLFDHDNLVFEDAGELGYWAEQREIEWLTLVIGDSRLPMKLEGIQSWLRSHVEMDMSIVEVVRLEPTR